MAKTYIYDVLAKGIDDQEVTYQVYKDGRSIYIRDPQNMTGRDYLCHPSVKNNQADIKKEILLVFHATAIEFIKK